MFYSNYQSFRLIEKSLQFSYYNFESEFINKMAQQIELQRSQSGYDNDGLQQLQRELDLEHQNLQRMTSTEAREDRQKMREIFESVRIWMILITNIVFDFCVTKNFHFL